ncbi:MAG: peptidase M14 [Candidatus Marinimicrobia bacterium]|nr:peptidase M14 [Candidatus Neomarinimicrobiota bacterium]
MKNPIRFLLILALSIPLTASDVEKIEFVKSALKAMGAPNQPKVEVQWNRYYNNAQIGEICRKIAAAYPQLTRYEVIGKSYEERDIHSLTITDFSSGKPEDKPGMYIDGNIHSNEIQGAEVSLYTAWYLTENFEKNEWIQELMKNKTFYILPSINPDARDHYISEGNTPHSPRSGLVPRDDDGDGAINEDGFDDLDGDGHIVSMRIKDPNGRWKESSEITGMMVPCKENETGDYTLLGNEGIDNDGDGKINEDGEGFYDPNRNWPWSWQPEYIQYGADMYPLSIKENRIVADYILSHENIAGAQSYHNSGGMILRGPGSDSPAFSYHDQDRKYYDFIGKTGNKILPGYDYMVLYKDLYKAVGGEVDFFYGMRGIFSFTNELWSSFNYFGEKSKSSEFFGRREPVYKFNELLLFQEGIVPWKKINHPQYGEIEIGGFKKSWTRTAPSFMIEEMCHRNMAFTLFHAYNLPVVKFDEVTRKDIGDGLEQIDVILKNERVIPTRSYYEIEKQLTVPDFLEISSEDKNDVIAAMIVYDKYLNNTREIEKQPVRVKIDQIDGNATCQVRWIVKKGKKYTVKYTSKKAIDLESGL